jgi:hypothetical protein
MSTSDRTAVRPPLRQLAYGGGVRITGGPLADRIDDAVKTYLGLSVDDILYGFRKVAGLDAPGRPMTGWATRTTEATVGQWISGLTRIGVTSGRPEAVDRAVELARGWWDTWSADLDDHRMSGYGVEKVVCGLVDLAEFGGHPEMLELVEPIAKASSRVFPRDRPLSTAIDFEGGILAPTRTLEWYTFSENFYRAWRLGAADHVREFADEWHYYSFWDRFDEGPAGGNLWPVPTWLHAYSHLNSFASLAQIYLTSGNPRDLRILRHAYDYFTQTQIFATGGYGPGELTVPEDGTLGRSLEWRTDSAEIVCGSWAAFKLTDALMTCTGSAQFGDWAELLVFSGIGAVTPVRSSGKSPYYHDYRLGVATKLPHWDDWPCCSGTYLQCVGHLTDLIYYESDAGIAVNLYVPSTVRWSHGGSTHALTQRTDFPNSDNSEIQVETPGRYRIMLRIPAWSTGYALAVNDSPVPLVVDRQGWAVIDRQWSGGDRVTVTLGAGIRAVPVDRFHPNRVAFAHGPVVLAQAAEWTSPVALPTPVEMVDLSTAFDRSEDGLVYGPKALGTARLPQGLLKPLAEFPDRMPYRAYFDIDRPRII